VIEEIATNIVKYGYVGRATGVIQLQCFFADHKLHIAIRDQGHPFDPRTVDDPDLTGDVHARAIGGLGLFLVRELADDITYVHDAESGWNELLVIKHTHETQHD
jgi:anti-sigma regulatory factor (Ser/Thr protein kinase)